MLSCTQWFKDTNLKANHNLLLSLPSACCAVLNGSKILIWKQITTCCEACTHFFCCTQWFKDTNLKANHNKMGRVKYHQLAVLNGSKILIWKQITTRWHWYTLSCCCTQWFKDTNLKANHNLTTPILFLFHAVLNGSKILIWKQITTAGSKIIREWQLYSMVQRY